MPFSSALRMAAWFASVAAPFALMADLMTLRPVADTRLSEQFLDSNFGNATDIIIGTQGSTAGTPKNRGLMKFDLIGRIPPHSEITSVALTLTVTKVPQEGVDSIFELRRVLQTWNESEATWKNRNGITAPWSSPGGAAPTDTMGGCRAPLIIWLRTLQAGFLHVKHGDA